MISPNAFNWNFNLVPHKNKLLILLYDLDRKKSLYQVRNMSNATKINQPQRTSANFESKHTKALVLPFISNQALRFRQSLAKRLRLWQK